MVPNFLGHPVRVYARRIMYTNMRTVFRERVCEWYYLWSQLSKFPTLSARGLDMVLQVLIDYFTYL